MCENCLSVECKVAGLMVLKNKELEKALAALDCERRARNNDAEATKKLQARLALAVHYHIDDGAITALINKNKWGWEISMVFSKPYVENDLSKQLFRSPDEAFAAITSFREAVAAKKQGK